MPAQAPKIRKMLPKPGQLASRPIQPEKFHIRGMPYVPKRRIMPLSNGIRRLETVRDQNIAQLERKLANLKKAYDRVKNRSEGSHARQTALTQLESEMRKYGQEKGRLLAKFAHFYGPLAHESNRRLSIDPDYPFTISRAQFIESLGRRLRTPGSHTVGIYDLDRFAAFVKKYKHADGGEMISLFAKAVNNLATRYGGFCCVYGGDEIGVYIPGHIERTEEFSRKVKKEFKDVLRQSRFKNILNDPVVKAIGYSGILKDYSWGTETGLPIGYQWELAKSNRNAETALLELSDLLLNMKKVENKRKRVRLLNENDVPIREIFTARPGKLRRTWNYIKSRYLAER